MSKIFQKYVPHLIQTSATCKREVISVGPRTTVTSWSGLVRFSNRVWRQEVYGMVSVCAKKYFCTVKIKYKT